jgi:hypothetical protein
VANLVYKRVSTQRPNDQQSTARQNLVLAEAGIEDPVVFEEDPGTSSRLHPLFRELLTYARPGDTMHISEMFRLVRGTGHILDVLDVLHRDQVGRCASTTARSPRWITAPTATAEARPRWDTQVFSHVPAPGFPGNAYVHPGGRVYSGTYTNPQGDTMPSRVFEWTPDGTLQRSWTVPGQNLSTAHGVQVAISDAQRRLVLLDKSPGRALLRATTTGTFTSYATFPDLPTCPPLQGGHRLLAPADRRSGRPQLRRMEPRRQPLRHRLRPVGDLAGAARWRRSPAVAGRQAPRRRPVLDDRHRAGRGPHHPCW